MPPGWQIAPYALVLTGLATFRVVGNPEMIQDWPSNWPCTQRFRQMWAIWTMRKDRR